MSGKSSKSSKKNNTISNSLSHISSGAQRESEQNDSDASTVNSGPVYGIMFRYTPVEQDVSKLTDISVKMIDHFKRQNYNYNFQLELGEETKLYHFQCFLHLKKKRRPATVVEKFREEFKDKSSIYCAHCHSVTSSSIYCQKFDTSVAGPWTDNKIKPATGWDIKCIEDNPYPWQKTIIDEVIEPCRDDRTINWLYDPDGNLGKSKLVKWLAVKHDVIPLAFAKANDLIMLYLDNRGRNAYMFDLTRCKPMDIGKGDLYAAMEQIKNGSVTGGKFKGGIAHQDPPHIWVFSNMLPDMKCLSLDRWKIWQVDKEKKLKKFVKKIPMEKIKIEF